MDKEYEICKEACKNEGCYCPEDFNFHNEVAKTPIFIRAYFYLKGLKSGKSKLFPSKEIKGMLTDGKGGYYPDDDSLSGKSALQEKNGKVL